jgi:hypothetical protein
MSRPVSRVATEDDHDLLAGYALFCATLPITDTMRRARLRAARAFLAAHPDLAVWMERPLASRLVDLHRIEAWPLLSYLACEGTLSPDIDLLLAKDLGGFGATAERFWGADFERASSVAARLGWSPRWTGDVLRECLPLVLAWTGKELGELGEADLDAFRSAVEASPAATRWSRRGYSSRLFSIRILLYELGILGAPPRRSLHAATLAERFLAVPAPEIRRAMLAYLDARSAVLARSSLEGLANSLIVFGEYLGAHHPEIGSLRALERRHVEGFLVWNRTRPWRGRLARPKAVSISVAHEAVLTLRNFLDDVTLWRWAERPARRLVFASDVPRLPRPLPRALAPDVDRALMAAVDRLTDPFARTAITLLRRAGLRLGEASTSSSTPSSTTDQPEAGCGFRSASSPPSGWCRSIRAPSRSSTRGPMDAAASARFRIRGQVDRPTSCSSSGVVDSDRGVSAPGSGPPSLPPG